MDPIMLASIVLLGGFIVLMLLRVPVSFALLIPAAAAALIANWNTMSLMVMYNPAENWITQIATQLENVVVSRMVKGVDSFSLLSIPFFILAGEIMGTGGISERLIAFANMLVGWMPGGLAMVNCVASMLFGGISGSAVADVSSLGTMLIPMMKKQGYDAEFSVGITVTSACQGILIPPSHNMIIFMLAVSGTASVSVAKLFMGGAVPGILLGIALMVISYILAKIRHYPISDPVPKGKRLKTAIDGILPLGTIIIIIGGTTLGICTATEAAAIAVLYAFILSFFILRDVKIRDAMPGILKNSMKTLAIVLTLIASANAFAGMMTSLHIPEAITNFLVSITDNKIVLLLIINVLLLFLGCIMDLAPLLLIMTPILAPICVTQLGMDPIHFGIMMIFNLGIGLCTPPVGCTLFVGCAIGNTKIEKTSVSMLPLYATMVIMLLLITFVPQITMFVPNLM